jgi:hypothetical protein
LLFLRPIAGKTCVAGTAVAYAIIAGQLLPIIKRGIAMNPRGCSDARSHCGTQNRAGGAAVPAALSSSNVWVGFNPVLRSAAAPVLVTAAFLWLELIVPDVLAATREASEFSVPAGRPDESSAFCVRRPTSAKP